MPGKVTITGMIMALLFVYGGAEAQKIEVGLLAGGSGYMGDLNPSRYQRYTDLAFGGLLRWNINPRNSVRFSFLHCRVQGNDARSDDSYRIRSEEHTSELQSLMRISSDVFCFTKKH